MFKNKHCALVVIFFMLTFSFTLNFKSIFVNRAFAQNTDKDLSDRIVNRLQKQGDDAAIKAAEEYLVLNPNDTGVLCALAETYLGKKNLPAAERLANRAITERPSDPWASKVLADIDMFKVNADPTNISLTLERINKALVNNPNNVPLLIDKARMCIAKGDMDNASVTVDKALSLLGQSQQGMDPSFRKMLIDIKEKQITKTTAGKVEE